MKLWLNNQMNRFVRKVYDWSLELIGWRGLQGDRFADFRSRGACLKKLKTLRKSIRRICSCLKPPPWNIQRMSWGFKGDFCCKANSTAVSGVWVTDFFCLGSLERLSFCFFVSVADAWKVFGGCYRFWLGKEKPPERVRMFSSNRWDGVDQLWWL